MFVSKYRRRLGFGVLVLSAVPLLWKTQYFVYFLAARGIESYLTTNTEELVTSDISLNYDFDGAAIVSTGILLLLSRVLLKQCQKHHYRSFHHGNYPRHCRE